MSEQRIAERVPTQTAVALLVMEAPAEPALEGQGFTAETRDISLTGLGLHMDRSVPAGTRLEIRISLGDPSQTFTVTGQVIWCAPGNSPGSFRTGIHLMAQPDDTSAWRQAVLQRVAS